MVGPLTSSPAPVASTSRIPYGSPAAAAASAPGSATPPTRTFFTSRPSPYPRAHTSHRRAHLIHPLARQRLTNVAFALAGVLSVATVSLGMSGSLGSAGVRPGCPARKDAAVALQGEQLTRARGDAQQARGSSWKGKGRFLDDPVAPIPPPAVRSREAAASSPLPVGRIGSASQGEQRASSVRGDGPDGRIAEDDSAPTGKGACGWRGWVGASERVV
ncbi:hypothetical protein JCM3775_005957 [Rhodotorula graminis]|uniref:Uncharacterized protein n=1 Tax=Rhodotorula graminis (strain WP1) TaxID=578459 RepID=A0A194SCM3_RHOGW|nr:uncharacterized protein RHOBADRAFT_40910 [Rhodotorula graminis WP1]KPV78364.1 hypothetical protein RHOBADRAFT_40910 [Rhodotorula graminis WP1]